MNLLMAFLRKRKPLPLLPEVATFLGSHPEFGRAVGTQDIPDWAHGKRQRVAFAWGRNLLFYVRAGNVITVYEDIPGRGRQKIWGEYSQLPEG